jgi:hypothetical protein
VRFTFIDAEKARHWFRCCATCCECHAVVTTCGGSEDSQSMHCRTRGWAHWSLQLID